MADRLSAAKVGLVLAAVMGGWHLCWLILVAAGMAQAVIDFIFWMHFIRPIYIVEPFTFDRAAILFIVTASMGFAAGAAIACLWNIVHQQRQND